MMATPSAAAHESSLRTTLDTPGDERVIPEEQQQVEQLRAQVEAQHGVSPASASSRSDGESGDSSSYGSSSGCNGG